MHRRILSLSFRVLHVLFSFSCFLAFGLCDLQVTEVSHGQKYALQGALSSIAGCGFGSSDLSPLMGTLDIDGTDPVFNYYMNMCGVVNDAKCASSKPGAMVCQSVQPGKGFGLYALAYFQTNGQPAGTWSYYNGAESSGLSVVYTNGDGNCLNPATNQNEARQLTINFPCSTTQDVTFTFTTDPQDVCHYTILFNTPLSCPGTAASSSSSSGLSGGWIFIILFVVLVSVYVIAGCIYKTKMQGATGIERCPNIDIWREVPLLIKEGAIFTWRKCAGLCSSSSSGGRSSYETV